MEREDILKQALDKVLPLHRSGVAISMRMGKTWLALKHMENNYTDSLRVLVVAPKVSIYQTWKDMANEYDMAYLTAHIEFTTYLSIDKQDLDYDIIYLDECHSLLYSHDPYLSKYTGKILGLTGSPPRYHHSEKGEMVERYCPIVFTYGVDSAVEDKILNDYRIVVHSLQLGKKKDLLIKSKTKQWYSSEEVNYNYWTQRIQDARSPREEMIMKIMRMKALMGFKTKEIYARGLFNSIQSKCILFANEQAQADRLCGSSYHANNPLSEENLKQLQEGSITRLAAVLQLSEGITVPGLSEVIIMHSYSNERKTSQRIGRILGLAPGELATAHILMYTETIDVTWVSKALEDFNESKIIYK